MKTNTNAGRSLLAMLVLTLFAVMARALGVNQKEIHCNAATDKLLESGKATVVAEAAFATRYLLAAKGTAAKSAILCTAALEPTGIMCDEPAIGESGAVALLGATEGTQYVVASKAIAENTRVYATAAGKVTDAVVSGAFLVGKTQPGSIAAADGDRIAIIPTFPRVNP